MKVNSWRNTNEDVRQRHFCILPLLVRRSITAIGSGEMMTAPDRSLQPIRKYRTIVKSKQRIRAELWMM